MHANLKQKINVINANFYAFRSHQISYLINSQYNLVILTHVNCLALLPWELVYFESIQKKTCYLNNK